jgi:hypothetical protein
MLPSFSNWDPIVFGYRRFASNQDKPCCLLLFVLEIRASFDSRNWVHYFQSP